MKFTVESLLLVVLSLFLSVALRAQSEIERRKPSAFPSQITHVVVIVQENRTPDNLFHFLSPLCTIPKGASGLNACTPSPVTSSCYDISPCGLSNKSGSVVPITLSEIPLTGSTNPAHSHKAFSQMCDPDPANGYACRNDGAWQIKNTVKGANSYVYVENTPVTNYDGSKGYILDPYLTYAEQYGWANYMYQTNQGSSYPAHQFIFSGTSARTAAEDANSTFVSEDFAPTETHGGCLAPKNTTSWLISPVLGSLGDGCLAYDSKSVQACPLTNTALDPPTNPVGSFCDSKPTMGSVLDTEAVTWKYYAPNAGDIWTAPNSIQSICVPQFIGKTSDLECTGTEWNANVDLNHKGADVLNDITNCNLSSVSWVIPDGDWSDHPGPGGANIHGPSWVAALINSIGQNPVCPAGTLDAGQTFWNNTAIIVTWDDWGGFSDNQPPVISPGLPCTSNNCQADYQYGFRVPLIVVSAYTPQGYINNETQDFGSILRTIEGIYGITQGTLGFADVRSTTDLSGFFTGAFRAYTPVPAVEPASYFLGKKAQAGPPTPPDDDEDDTDDGIGQDRGPSVSQSGHSSRQNQFSNAL
jgi:phospholipase C